MNDTVTVLAIGDAPILQHVGPTFVIGDGALWVAVILIVVIGLLSDAVRGK